MTRVKLKDGRFATYNESYARRLVACGRATLAPEEKVASKKKRPERLQEPLRDAGTGDADQAQE